MFIEGIFRIDKNNENEQTRTPYNDMVITYKIMLNKRKKTQSRSNVQKSLN